MNCDHEETHVTFDPRCGQIITQCRQCGERIGTALPHKDHVASSLPVFDHDLRDLIRERQQEIREQERRNRQYIFESSREKRRHKYMQHLSSEQWKEKRRAVIERERGICQGCRKSSIAEIHHLTYDNIGDELLFQLVGLCVECHQKAHNPTKSEFYEDETI